MKIEEWSVFDPYSVCWKLMLLQQNWTVTRSEFEPSTDKRFKKCQWSGEKRTHYPCRIAYKYIHLSSIRNLYFNQFYVHDVAQMTCVCGLDTGQRTWSWVVRRLGVRDASWHIDDSPPCRPLDVTKEGLTKKCLFCGWRIVSKFEQ